MSSEANDDQDKKPAALSDAELKKCSTESECPSALGVQVDASAQKPRADAAASAGGASLVDLEDDGPPKKTPEKRKYNKAKKEQAVNKWHELMGPSERQPVPDAMGNYVERYAGQKIATLDQAVEFVALRIENMEVKHLYMNLQEFYYYIHGNPNPKILAERMNELGAYSIIFDCVKENLEQEDSQESGLLVLENCLWWSYPSPDLGSVQFALRIARRYPNNARIQCRAIDFLFCLLNPKNEMRKDEASIFSFLDGLDWLLDSMTEFKKIANVQMMGCGLIYRFAQTNSEHRQAVIDKDAMSVIYSSIERHKKKSGVVEEGEKVLKYLSQPPAVSEEMQK